MTRYELTRVQIMTRVYGVYTVAVIGRLTRRADGPNMAPLRPLTPNHRREEGEGPSPGLV